MQEAIYALNSFQKNFAFDYEILTRRLDDCLLGYLGVCWIVGLNEFSLFVYVWCKVWVKLFQHLVQIKRSSGLYSLETGSWALLFTLRLFFFFRDGSDFAALSQSY